jgi:hypothetical protein
MKRVMAHIEQRKARIAAHPFYRWVAGGRAPLARRFDFAPLLVNFIMGFADMNRLFMRYGAPSSDQERAINRHTWEDETHSRLFIEDWRKLGLDQDLGWSAGDTLAWYHAAPQTEMFREHGMEILRMLTEDEDPLLRFVLMESIEAWGHVMFSATAGAAASLTGETGTQYRYFGPHHLKRELGHLLSDGELFEREVLDGDRLARADALVRRLFDIAEAESDALLHHAEQVIERGGPPPRAGFAREHLDHPVLAAGASAPRRRGEGRVPPSQERLERQLEQRKQAAARHPLFRWMAEGREQDPESKLRRLALFWAPDCLGYKDLNAYALAYPRPVSPHERAIQRRVTGLMSHHRLFLRDWAELGMDERLRFSASDTLDFYCISARSEVQRRSVASFLKLAFRHTDPALRFWLVEALEASGEAFFENTRRLARKVEAERGSRLDYFADRHEIAHPVLSPDAEADAVVFQAEALDAEREDVAASILHTVFDCLENQLSASLEQATSGALLDLNRTSRATSSQARRRAALHSVRPPSPGASKP